jgi:uncharacterized short protein YbdD (DUF466 family)
MQRLQHHHDPDHIKQMTLEDFTPERLLDPSKVKPGLGLVCEYCQLRTGYSVCFSSREAYVLHCQERHPDRSVYALREDLNKEHVDQAINYRRKLRAWQKERLKLALDTAKNIEKMAVFRDKQQIQQQK